MYIKQFFYLCAYCLACSVIFIAGGAEAELTGITQVAAGWSHSCAITTEGGVKCWGSNSVGQLGGGDDAIYRELPSGVVSTAIDVQNISTGAIQIVVGSAHSCVLLVTGGVKCWGAERVVGDGTDTARNSPVDVIGLGAGVKEIATSYQFTCAITNTNSVKCWGRNDFGELGDGSTTFRNAPVDVLGLPSNVRHLAVGQHHACALMNDGAVKCWGLNDRGELGNGTTTSSSLPVDVIGLSLAATAISAGIDNTCAILSDGSLKCWGSNSFGQLGDGTWSSKTSPTPVSGLSSGVKAVATGAWHNCALTTTDALKCWGSNRYGQTGDGTITSRNVPVDMTNLNSTPLSISLGFGSSCAVTSLTNVQCWGQKEGGIMGDGTMTSKYVPVNVPGLGTDILNVEIGNQSACAINEDGGVLCWGDNSWGQLGMGSNTPQFAPVNVVGLATGVKALSLGSTHACAVTASGGVKCWGFGDYGQLGVGSNSVFIPTDVVGLTSGAQSVVASGGFTCTLTAIGGVKCWGANWSGELGDGSTNPSATPVDVVGLSSGVKALASGESHACALMESGGVKCWGNNSYQQLGDPQSLSSSSTPVDVPGLVEEVTAISANGSNTCALAVSGKVKCWGSTAYGATSSEALPPGISQVGVGGYYGCALTTTGGVKCWGNNSGVGGNNSGGYLGDWTVIDRSAPVDTIGLSSEARSLAVGPNSSCAITNGGTVKCWGSNQKMLLGDPSIYTQIHTVLQGFKLHGRVYLNGGEGIPGVRMQVSGLTNPSHITPEGTTASNGNYSLPFVEQTIYTVRPVKTGYTFTPQEASGTVTSDLLQDFVADYVRYNISGTVTSGGNPLIGAVVNGGALGTRTTDDVGNYSFQNVIYGTNYTLTVTYSDDGYGINPLSTSGTITNDAIHDFSPQLLPLLTIGGQVTYNGAPLVGVTITESGNLGSAVTDSNGNFSFANVIEGTTYSLTVSKPGYTFTPASLSGTASQNVSLNAVATLKTHNISGATLVGGNLKLSDSPSAFSSGGEHTCGVTPQGGVMCWGGNFSGQLGNGTTSDSSSPVNVQGLDSGIIAVSAGYEHTCALSNTGTVACWGYNEEGELGNGTWEASSVPVLVVGVTEGVVAISSGEYHTCALMTYGGVKCWGYAVEGDSEEESRYDSETPIAIPGLDSGVNEIVAGSYHTCALLTGGFVKCWGTNYRGELGNGNTDDIYTPVDLTVIGEPVHRLALGSQYTCALLQSDRVQCWGDNDFGQLGNGTRDDSVTPVDVIGLGNDTSAIATGSDHTCALSTRGEVKCWGRNDYGQIGNGNFQGNGYGAIVVVPAPAQVSELDTGVTQIELGAFQSCALAANSELQCWGDNRKVQLGRDTSTVFYSPTDVKPLNDQVEQIEAGHSHSCALTDTGELKCWGDNYFGQLGDGTQESSYLPVVVQGLNGLVREFSLGNDHSCALLTDRTVQCWGHNGSGQLGNSTFNTSLTHVMVDGLGSSVKAIALGNHHSCALTTGGEVKCWGQNSAGQLGNGQASDSPVPENVTGLRSQVVAISAGESHTCALNDQGEVQCWGYNFYGQLGDGTTTVSSVPVDVDVTSFGAIEISAEGHHTCVASAAGQVKCWGLVDYDVSGDVNLQDNFAADGFNFSSLVPVDIPGWTSGMRHLTGGYGHVCALNASNGVECWGRNGGGALGNGTNVDSYQPVLSSGLASEVRDIAAGSGFSCALTLSGQVKCWGDNYNGQVGNPDANSIPGPIFTYLPVEGVRVGGAGLLGLRYSDQNGLFNYSTIPFGTTYTLIPSKAGFKFSPTNVSNTLSGDVSHTFIATPTTETHSISGRITFNGAPLAGVVVAGTLGQTVTDADGNYSFSGVLYGSNYNLSFTKYGFAFSPSKIEGVLIDDSTYDITGALTDVDNDGLTDVDEVARGTNPNLSDTDGDGLQDGAEVALGTNPRLYDSDGDGLNDSEENTYKTNPVISDTDEDGVSDGEEVTDNSNPLDRGSVLVRRDGRLCAEWNGFLGMWNVLENINNGTRKINVQSQLQDIFGNVKGNQSFGLKSGYQHDQLVHDMEGFERNLYGLVCSEAENAESGAFDGRMVFYKPDTNTKGYQFAFAMPLGSELRGTQYTQYNTYQPSLDPEDADNLVANWIQVTNLETNRRSGDLIFYDRAGQEVARQVVVLKGGSRFDYSAHDLAGLGKVGLVEWIPKENASRFLFGNVRYYYRRYRDNFDGALQLGGVVGSGELLSVALDGVGSSSVLEISNTRGEDVSVTVTVYGQNGGVPLSQNVLKLPGHSTYHFIADEILKGEKGIAEIRGNLPESVIATSMQYARTANLGIQNVYGIQARQALGTSLRGSYNTYLGQGCRLLMTNPTSSEVGTTVSMKRYDGTNVELVRLLAVPAHGLKDYDLCKQEEANFYGVVSVDLAVPNSIYATVLRIGNDEDYRFPTPVRE